MERLSYVSVRRYIDRICYMSVIDKNKVRHSLVKSIS